MRREGERERDGSGGRTEGLAQSAAFSMVLPTLTSEGALTVVDIVRRRDWNRVVRYQILRVSGRFGGSLPVATRGDRPRQEEPTPRPQKTDDKEEGTICVNYSCGRQPAQGFRMCCRTCGWTGGKNCPKCEKLWSLARAPVRLFSNQNEHFSTPSGSGVASSEQQVAPGAER